MSTFSVDKDAIEAKRQAALMKLKAKQDKEAAMWKRKYQANKHAALDAEVKSNFTTALALGQKAEDMASPVVTPAQMEAIRAEARQKQYKKPAPLDRSEAGKAAIAALKAKLEKGTPAAAAAADPGVTLEQTEVPMHDHDDHTVDDEADGDAFTGFMAKRAAAAPPAAAAAAAAAAPKTPPVVRRRSGLSRPVPSSHKSITESHSASHKDVVAVTSDNTAAAPNTNKEEEPPMQNGLTTPKAKYSRRKRGDVDLPSPFLFTPSSEEDGDEPGCKKRRAPMSAAERSKLFRQRQKEKQLAATADFKSQLKEALKDPEIRAMVKEMLD